MPSGGKEQHHVRQIFYCQCLTWAPELCDDGKSVPLRLLRLSSVQKRAGVSSRVGDASRKEIEDARRQVELFDEPCVEGGDIAGVLGRLEHDRAATFCANCITGALNGVIAATTPMGSFSVNICELACVA